MILTDPPSLAEMFTRVINELKLGPVQRKHPFHIMQLATVRSDGQFWRPEIRSVVFKEFIEDTFEFIFHTDKRSPKFTQIEKNHSVALHLYDFYSKLQIRVEGEAQVLERNHPVYLNHVKSLSPSGLRCYVGPFPPSTSMDFYHCNVQEQWVYRAPSSEEIPEDIENFEVISVKPSRIECLNLRAHGHVRCAFEVRTGQVSKALWLTP